MASVKNRSHRVLFCLGSVEPEAIELDLLASVFLSTRSHMGLFFFLKKKIDTLLASVLVTPEAIWASFFFKKKKFDTLLASVLVAPEAKSMLSASVLV